MAEISPKEPIDTLIFDESLESNVTSFEWRKHLFDFGIDSDLSLNENKTIPVFKEQFFQNMSGLHVDLEDGFREAKENKKLIKNFDNNRRKTWIHFLRCLQKHNTIVEEEPTFVTLTPLLCNLFAVEEWDSTFFAIKFKGVIYLFRNQSLEMSEVEEEVRPHPYFMVRFLYLITNRDDSDINAFEMCLKVDRIELNGKRVIVCNGIAGNDKNGSPIYVKCRQIFRRFSDQERERLLYDWSHCKISGVQTLVRGRRYKSTLQDIDVIDVETIPEWSPSKRFSFVDQSLDFIKSCVRSELELYEFEINAKDKTLLCFKHESNGDSDHFLPDFYIQ